MAERDLLELVATDFRHLDRRERGDAMVGAMQQETEGIAQVAGQQQADDLAAAVLQHLVPGGPSLQQEEAGGQPVTLGERKSEERRDGKEGVGRGRHRWWR